GERAGDALDRLDLGDHELAQRVDVVAARLDDHVVGTGDVIGGLHALALPHLLGDDGRFPDLRLNQDVRLNQLSLLCSRGSGECSRSAGTWYRELARCRELCSSRYQ